MTRATLLPGHTPGRPRPRTAADLLVPILGGVLIGFPLGYLSAGPKGGKVLWETIPAATLTEPTDSSAPNDAAHDRKPSNTAAPVPKNLKNLPKPPSAPGKSSQRLATPQTIPAAAVRPVCKPGDLIVEER
jgi:hypothetical protein